jgi:hypothetical protein
MLSALIIYSKGTFGIYFDPDGTGNGCVYTLRNAFELFNI